MTAHVWPERPARAGLNTVIWPAMTVIFRGDDEPAEAEDGDQWEGPDGTFVRRNGEWVRR